MHVLEARFHPLSKSGPSFVTMGRVLCKERGASLEKVQVPPGALKPFDPERLYSQLNWLVGSATDPARDLLQARSKFWSFVEISPADSQGL